MYQRILAPIDGNEVSNQALQEAAKLAKGQHSSDVRLAAGVTDVSTDSGRI